MQVRARRAKKRSAAGGRGAESRERGIREDLKGIGGGTRDERE